MRELVFELHSGDADAISDQLMARGALAVTVEDAQANSADEAPIFGEPGMASDVQTWPASKVIALLDAAIDPQTFWESFCVENPSFAESAMEVRTITDQDWVSETQRQFTPFQVGQRLWVGPHWNQPPAEITAHGLVIRLDPGMAFGTGSHATTQLCLESLLACFQGRSTKGMGGGRVLDMGCGSGILAIAAAKLGAGEVTAVDIDPIAVETASRNADHNQVRIHAINAQMPLGPAFDVVMANILAQPLKVLAPALARQTKPGGALLLSGILARQADEILQVYAPLSDHLGPLAVLAQRDGWVCIGTLGRGRYDGH